jgi:hypothetical protein
VLFDEWKQHGASTRQTTMADLEQLEILGMGEQIEKIRVTS